MSRFQSHLFNWVQRSFPVALGRKARRALDRLTSELINKIAQVVTEEESEPSSSNGAIKKLLKPVYSLVKIFRQSQTVSKVAAPVSDLQGLDKMPNLAIKQNIHNQSNNYQAQAKLEELVARAIAYFNKKKRTLPAPSLPAQKAERMTQYEQLCDDQDDQIVSCLQVLPVVAQVQEQSITESMETMLAWEEELESYSMRAWIETQAVSLGYAESPIIKFLLWLDKLIAYIERWLIEIWQKIVRWYFSKFTDRG